MQADLSRPCQKRSVVKKSRRSNLLLQRHHQGYRNRNDANLCLSCSYRSSLSHIQNSRLKTSYNGFKSRLRVPCSIAPIAAPQRHKDACYALHKRLCDRYWLKYQGIEVKSTRLSQKLTSYGCYFSPFIGGQFQMPFWDFSFIFWGRSCGFL